MLDSYPRQIETIDTTTMKRAWNNIEKKRKRKEQQRGDGSGGRGGGKPTYYRKNVNFQMKNI